MTTIEDSTSSSDKKTNEPTIIDEDDDDEPVKKQAGDKLAIEHLISFGFNLAEEANKNPGKWDDGGGAGGNDFSKAVAAAKKARSKNKNQTVVYGAEPGDMEPSDFNDDYDDDHDVIDDDSDEDDEEQDDQEEGETEEYEGETEMDEHEERPGYNYFDDYLEGDDMWEDEEDEEEDNEEDEDELDRQQQEAYEAAVQAAEEERERVRELKLIDIMKKKEILVDRYLRVARIMITHRKKNIYLQDYLYHLALRKGVLRGDTQNRGSNNTMDSDESETILSKAMKRRQQRKNTTMASRFARFLRKTGHFFDEDNPDDRHHHHHNRNDPAARSRHHRHHQHESVHKSAHSVHEQRIHSNFNQLQHNSHHFGTRYVPNTVIRKSSRACPEALEGKSCPLNRRTKAKVKNLRKRHERHYARVKKPRSYVISVKSLASMRSTDSKRPKPRTLAEILEQKAAQTLYTAMKTANDGLNAFERHRCRMAKKKQLIKITKLLERQYGGTTVLEQERDHLVSFVEQSVKAQNLAKKKALRRQQKNKTQNKAGPVNLNHQWTKSLERIRELRLKKAKLEQDHRLVLLRKIKHWHIWEKRDATAIETVQEFVTDMASRVTMSRRETLSFQQGMEHFRKQLYSLHETMVKHVVKMFKAQHMLFMAQRNAKDNTSVAAPTMKGFSISDFERMTIENQESHQKLMERQDHLVEMYDKLKEYIKKVADSHLSKQRSYGALRTGRHDMKQLWELCMAERDNLLKKLSEIRKVKLLDKRLFMQIAVMENKRLFKDFQRVNNCVQELKDKERVFHAQLYQVQSILRVLNVKYVDTQLRTKEAEKANSDQATKDGLEQSSGTIRQRICPRLPNTVYNVNVCSNKSQKEILEKESKRLGTPTRTEEKRKPTKNKLPRVAK